MAESFDAELRDAITRVQPHLTPEELSFAVDNFVQYIDLVNEIWDSIQSDPERQARFAQLTYAAGQGTVESGPGRAPCKSITS